MREEREELLAPLATPLILIIVAEAASPGMREGKNRGQRHFLTYPSYNCPGGSGDHSAAASRPRLLRPRRAARPCICWDLSKTGAAGAVARPLLSTQSKQRDVELVSWQTIGLQFQNDSGVLKQFQA